MSTHNPWKTLSSRIVYQNPWIRVREDQKAYMTYIMGNGANGEKRRFMPYFTGFS